jgi:hypothetical protein
VKITINGKAEVAKQSIVIYQSIVGSFWATVAAFWSVLKVNRIYRHSKINSPSFESIFWVTLPLRTSLLPDKDNQIKILKPSGR